MENIAQNCYEGVLCREKFITRLACSCLYIQKCLLKAYYVDSIIHEAIKRLKIGKNISCLQGLVSGKYKIYKHILFNTYICVCMLNINIRILLNK